MHSIALIILHFKNWPQRSKRFNQAFEVRDLAANGTCRPKVPDAYSGQPIYPILQGIQLQLLLGRTRSDRPCLLHQCIYARACSTSIVT